MNKDLKKKWVRALRGDAPEGPYLQTVGRLHLGVIVHVDDEVQDRFCCLGVLANVKNLEGGVDGEDAFRHFAYNGSLNDIDQNNIDRLLRMNDHEHKSFDEIADWIEANL